jgi:DNA-binding IclR family transcriptional regulator
MPLPALAATRALAVLDYLAAHPTDEFTLSDLAAALDVNVSSMHAVLGVLTEEGYVVRAPRLRTYSLGPSVVALGSGALERHPTIDHARDEARRLSDELDLGVAITALAGDDIVFLARVGEHRAREVAVHVGQRIPLVPPLGAVFVAWLDDEPWLARAHDRAQMQALLDGVRTLGWAVSLATGSIDDLMTELTGATFDTQRTYDVVMIAAPVFGPRGDALVAMTLLGLEPRLTAAQIAEYGVRVRDAGLVATRRSGGRVPAA